MVGAILWLVGLYGVIVLGAFVVWVMDMGRDAWQDRVTVADLEQLRRLFDEDSAFVETDDNGEKWFVGYSKE